MNKLDSMVVTLLLAGWAPVLAGQDGPAPLSQKGDHQHVELVMERLEGGRWKALNPTTVLDRGDSVRFRLQASFPGYLYAYSISSKGEGEWLYPAPNSPAANRIREEVPYVIPSTTQSYTVEGDPGFDLIYWLISPKPISGERWVPSSDGPPVPKTIVPRCREDIDTAIACLDPRAGARQLPPAQTGWSGTGDLRPRELRLSPAHESTRIEATRGPGLFVYQFWIAHR